MTKRIWVLVIVCLVGVLGFAVAESNQEAEKSAVAAAEAWLELVDGGDYAKSWLEAASYLRGAVSKDTFEQQMSAARNPLGKVLSREVKKTTYMTTAPGAPDGEYVVIQTDTSFENKKSAVETITPMLDEDGKWRVSGYFIK
jgi:hypothetical protein